MATLAARAMDAAGASTRKPPTLSVTYQRLMLVMLLFAGITSTIVTRLVWLQVSTDRSNSGQVLNTMLPPRADIVDRNGRPLASTIDAWAIAIHPNRLLGNPQELAVKLAALMPEKSAAEYLAILKSGKSFTYLARRAVPELVAAVNALGEPAIEFSREPERLYPNTSLAAHVLGFTNMDGHGDAGIERALDERLSDPALRGEPVQLALDARVQQALEAELGTAMKKFSAVGAAGVVMDIKTGEVVAMTSLPTWNPNVPGQGSMDQQLMNRATLGVYELGSTFKPFTVAMAMDAGIVKSFGQMYPCPGGLRVGNHTISDTHPFGRACSVAEIMKESSNVGTAQIAKQLGAERQKAFLQNMGFMDKVSLELLERGRTLTPGANWGEAATMTVGFGHGIAVTPLHLASGYATLLNGGTWRPATLLKRGPGNPVPQGRRVFTEDTSYKMRALLRLVVTHGTGKKADAPGYRIGGKTGSAEKYHNRSLLVTTFAGVFPIDDPRYVIVAMLDEPKGISETYGFRTAAWNVGPVISKVVSRIGPMLGIQPDTGSDANMSEVMNFIRAEDH